MNNVVQFYPSDKEISLAIEMANEILKAGEELGETEDEDIQIQFMFKTLIYASKKSIKERK